MRTTDQRPNIVVLHCHDLGRHLACYGATTINSPHLDSLAADGILLESMFATAPQCSPSRSSLLTGRWPHANGVMGLTHGSFGWDLHPEEVHLAGHLSAAGYATEMLGVHHESSVLDDDAVAARLGFDRFRRGGTADIVADRAVEAVSRLASAEKPFYLQIGFFEPHRMPGSGDAEGTMGFRGDHIQPDTELGVAIPGYLQENASAIEEIAELQGAIKFMDRGVGGVLNAIRKSGQEENTLVLFTTDHGLALPRAKCSLYDPGVEVAAILRWPRRGWIGGKRSQELLSNVDVTPTILDAAGIAPRQHSPVMHGKSFAGHLDGGSYQPRREVFTEMTYHDYYDPRRGIRTNKWKFIANFSAAPGFMDPSQSWNRRCTPTAEARHSWDSYHPSFELYNVQNDPLELRDVSAEPEHDEVFRDLRGRLIDWMRETGDGLLTGAVTSPLHQQTTDILEQEQLAIG